MARHAHGEFSSVRPLNQRVWLIKVAGLGVAAGRAADEVGGNITSLESRQSRYFLLIKQQLGTDSSQLVRDDGEIRCKQVLVGERGSEGAGHEDEGETRSQHDAFDVQMSGFAKMREGKGRRSSELDGSSL